MQPLRRGAASVAIAMAVATAAAAQDPAPPPRFAYGLEAAATVGPDDTGFFNYTDYAHSVLRMAWARADASLRLGGRASLVAALRADTAERPRVFAAYARVRPWRSRAVDLQAGVIPPAFGSFARQGYGVANPLIGEPLGYQYLTSLRADSVPARADDLLRMRGRGWLSRFPVGEPAASNGVPLVSASRWDTGVQVRVGDAPVSATIALTRGSLARPIAWRDDNGGGQLAVRIEVRPAFGLRVGASAATGVFVARAVRDALPASLASASYAQRALGADAEYSRGYWLLRAEAILTDWRLPPLDASLRGRLAASAASAEARYKLRPRLYLAARVDHLGFGDVTGQSGARAGWDAPVWRLETGVGVKLLPRMLLKAAYQQNWREQDDGLGLAAVQLSWWR